MNTSLSQRFITKLSLSLRVPLRKHGPVPRAKLLTGKFPGENRTDASGGISAFQWHPNKNSAVFVGVPVLWPSEAEREFHGLKLLFLEGAPLGQKILGPND